MGKNRIAYLDNIKGIACILVVLQHVACYGYLYIETGTWNDYWVINHPINIESYLFNIIFIAVAKIAVPLFVMVNGALMLQKDIEYREILHKYVFRVLKVLIFWNIIMAIYSFLDKGGINDILSILIFGYQQFWFLYTLAGLYFMQPLLRVIVKNDKLLNAIVRIFILSILLNTLVVFLPESLGQIVSHLSSEIGISNLPKWCGYYCLGYYLFSREYKIKTRNIYAYIIIVLASIIFTILKSSTSNLFYLNGIEVYTLSTLIVSAIVFLYFKDYMKTENKLLLSINKNSFFIYAGHVALIEMALHYGISLDIFNFCGVGVVVATIIIISLLIVVKTVVIDKFKFLKGFCEW